MGANRVFYALLIGFVIYSTLRGSLKGYLQVMGLAK